MGTKKSDAFIKLPCRLHLFYRHSDFQSIQPQNTFEICLSKNNQTSNSLFDPRLGEGVSRGYQNEKMLKFVTSRLVKLLTWGNN